MATGINNIEKFMRDLFQNFRVKPSPDSWNKIADALDTTNPKDALIPEIDEIGTIFKGYKVTPSERVWQNIYKILERDKFTARRLSKSAVTAIIAFFSNTTATVITSLIVGGGLALLLLNPFKDDSTKMAAIKSTKQVNVINQNIKPSIINQPQISAQKQPAQLQNQGHQPVNNNTNVNSQIAKTGQNSYPYTKKHNVLNTMPQVVPLTPVNKNTDVIAITETQKPPISKDISTSNANVAYPIIIDTKTLNNNNLLLKSPSIKVGINQNWGRFDKGTLIQVDLQKKMDGLVDRFYRQWAKKFGRSRELFNLEIYYLPIYGSTTFIAHQENSPTLSRSYNEYLIGGPSNCLGINFGYNHRKFVYESGIIYEDRHTRRNDDLTWISYDTNITVKKDTIGFVTIDGTIYTLFNSTIDTNINKNELKKNYRSRMTYHTIEVPFLVGYKLIDKRNTFIVRAGILASIIVKTEEETSYIDESAQPYIIYPNKNNLDFSYTMNVSYDINLNDNFRISPTLAFRYNITGLYKGYTINKNPATYGLGIGVKYSF